MADKTSSGEPTFGIAKHKTVKVESESGTVYAGYHDGETWYEGHYSPPAANGSSSSPAPVQLAEAPVKLA